ncbi:MAG: cell division/cell wall cluster transcriptional repressor MraZ [Patescibacteria group bacterium]|nr:cell division/cell wall cluster transcriptional repressor MraZ [Patescibacteria group bacterium]
MVKLLIGQYRSRVSHKGRVAFPKTFREILGKRIILTRGYEGCLIAVSEERWQTLTESTEDKPFAFGAARDTARFLLGNAALVELDQQGRFVIPPHLREYGILTEEAIFLGLSRYVEIWGKSKWADYQEYLTKNIDWISEGLNKGDEK